MREKPWLQQVVEAISKSDLAADERHLMIVMASGADHRTATGIAGQKALAEATGRTDRHVRGTMAQLAARTEGPRIRLQRRFTAAGVRTTDRYILDIPGVTTLQERGSARPTDDGRPTHRVSSSEPQESRSGGPTGKARLVQRNAVPALPERRSGDQGSDQGSDQGNVHPRPDGLVTLSGARRRTGIQGIGTERRCPSDLAEHPEMLAALAREAHSMGQPFDVLHAALREFVDFRINGNGRASTRQDWIGAAVTHLRARHAHGDLGATASRQEHQERTAANAGQGKPGLAGAPVTVGAALREAIGGAE